MGQEPFTKKVEIQEKKTVFDDKFKIVEATVRYQRFNGEMGEPARRLSFERGDSAAAIILNTEEQKVLLISQFRYPTYEKGPGWLTEAVAGVVDEGEQPEETIKREIMEEIGYSVKQVTPIGVFYTTPGGSSERIYLYYTEVKNADRTGKGGGKVSEHEDIELLEYSLADIWRAVDEQEIVDGKTLVGLMWLRHKLAKEGKE